MFSIRSRLRDRLSAQYDPLSRITGRRGEGGEPAVTSPAPMSPASMSEVADALSRAALCDGKHVVHDADLIIGRVTAARLVEHLRGAGFVIVRSEAGVPVGKAAIGAPAPYRGIAPG